jgi:hypothetical protein
MQQGDTAMNGEIAYDVTLSEIDIDVKWTKKS